MTAFQRLKDRILKSSKDRSHYQALRYYLIASKSLKHFSSQGTPSRHPWVENMRWLLRKLGFDKLMRFLNWCVRTHRAPWRKYLGAFFHPRVKRQLKGFTPRIRAATCQLCGTRDTLPALPDWCASCGSMTGPQRAAKRRQIDMRRNYRTLGLTSLSAYTRRMGLGKDVSIRLRSLAAPYGEYQGDWGPYVVYTQAELNRVCLAMEYQGIQL